MVLDVLQCHQVRSKINGEDFPLWKHFIPDGIRMGLDLDLRIPPPAPAPALVDAQKPRAVPPGGATKNRAFNNQTP